MSGICGVDGCQIEIPKYSKSKVCGDHLHAPGFCKCSQCDTNAWEVIEVDTESGKVKMMTNGPKNLENAEAIEKMAIMRRSTRHNFFKVVPVGQYSDGDKY